MYRKAIKYFVIGTVHIVTLITISIPLLLILFLASLSWQSIYHTKIWIPQDKNTQIEISVLVDQYIMDLSTVSNSWQNTRSKINHHYHHPQDKILPPETEQLFNKLVAQKLIKPGLNYQLFSRGNSRYPEQAGLLSGFLGSLVILITITVISIPMGFAAAIYFTEFARKSSLNYFLELMIYNLSAVPSVIFGLTGFLLLIKPEILQKTSYLSASIIISALIIPIIIISAKNALQAVPKNIRKASLALGANTMETTIYQILPVALPGMLSGVIIALARALGEVAPLLFIGLTAFIINTQENLMHPATTLPTQIYIWAISPETSFWSIAATGTLLIIFLLLTMTFILVKIQNKSSERY